MQYLTVLYDPHSAPCRRCRNWFLPQPQYVTLRFVAVGSAFANERFAGLAPDRDEFTAIGDDGSVYRGGKAFLMCLWALRKYRAWAVTASPAQLPSAQRFLEWTYKNGGHLVA